MRIVFVGASEETVATARMLIKHGHEIVIVEADRAKIDELSEELDCSFLHGDGSRPAILREVNPKQVDMLFCLSDNDQSNIIASLVGRSLGFKHVVTSITDAEFEAICEELSLEHTIIPSQTIARHLVDMVRGVDTIELSTILREDARFFTFRAKKEDAGPISQLDLPDEARVVFFYRDDRFFFADADSKLREGDEVVILTHSKNVRDLEERWHSKKVENREG